LRVVRYWIGITDWDWFRFLAARPELPEVNVWQPSAGRQPVRLVEGALFLFKLHSSYGGAIVGGGVLREVLGAAGAADVGHVRFRERSGRAQESGEFEQGGVTSGMTSEWSGRPHTPKSVGLHTVRDRTAEDRTRISEASSSTRIVVQTSSD
jgi:hypothetical protein